MKLKAKPFRNVLPKKNNMFEKEIQKYLKKHGFEAFTPQAVLFDMDGVLYDSMPNHAVAWKQSMKEFGIHMTAEDSYATEGARGVDTIRYMMKEQKGINISEEEAQKMYDVKTEYFHKMPVAPIFDGVLQLMTKIKNSGLQIGVVTGSGQKPLIQRLLADFSNFLDEEHIVSAYDVKLGKPNPEPYLTGLKKAGNLEPNEAIVVENAPLGVRAGVAARIFTVAINSGPLSDNALIKEGADILYSSILDFAKNWNELIK